MTLRTLVLSTAVAASAVVAFAAPAMAQPYGQGPYGPPPVYNHGYQPGYPPPPPGGPYGQFHDDLGQREQGLQDMIQRGAQQGWLRGFQARRAFSTLGNIRREDHDMRRQNGGWLRGDQKFQLNQQINDLTRYVRSIHDSQGVHYPW